MKAVRKFWKKWKNTKYEIMNTAIKTYHNNLTDEDKAICIKLYEEINKSLTGAEHKIWHRMPVWFINGNPIVGYSKLKDCVRLLFWSGRSFEEDGLQDEGGFKTAGVRYTTPSQIKVGELRRWLKKSKVIQWDYKNIVKRKGKLERITANS